MTDAFHIDVPHTDGALAVIALSGEFDITTAPAVRARALELIAAGHPDLVADLSGVTFCDSSGLGALVGIWRCARDADGSLTLATIPDRLDRLLSLTGMDTFLPAYPSAAAALTARQGNRTTA
ncbi:anti-anti-sigma factor [Streptomyces agglomeratus]|uniref:Anti-sigma factor antagonist n=1 Tax=Streptomyces agglomeratus TaxID=285458 RepID=A0A1E5NY10_9ACTN|nr:STAS domain-containing protein [Streptomyces agglomeratus]OEJ21195.1 anti-anti-sigma factor [Streptomyces agglomeratus]OEJ36581.1 anti-anti-sigma factor [Streptomyces agglomeratus]OEJ56299.1 anti-anti-sigma factor [Streptomyces agglomeratus]